jgi:membrane glycosyltransferase
VPIEITLASQRVYWSLLIGIYLVLATLHYIALEPITSYRQVIYAIVLITIIPLSYVTLQTILSIHYGKTGTKYHKIVLQDLPKAAVILGIYNDFTPHHFRETIINNPGFDFFLLSDSDLKHADEEKSFCLENNVHYIHRENRRGKKAGAINDWANTHLIGYSYFAPLDKDSVLGKDNVRQMLEFAEHPFNRRIGAFQSRIKSLPGNSLFSNLRSTIANLYLGQYPRNDTLALGEAIYWGHNALVRSETFLDVGGQDENHLNEDISFTMRMRAAGWKVAYLTDVQSYEEQPGDLPSEIERLSRWMRGSYESSVLALLNERKIGLGTTWLIALSGLLYSSAVLLCVLLTLTAINAIFSLGQLSATQVSYVAAVILLVHTVGILYFGPILPMKKDLKMVKILFLLLVNSIISIPSMLRALLVTAKFMVSRKAPWSPTRIENVHRGLFESFKFALPEFVFGLFLLYSFSLGGIGSVLQFLPWIGSFMLAPVAIYFSSRNSDENSARFFSE